MRIRVCVCLLLLAATFAPAQELTGTWEGVIASKRRPIVMQVDWSAAKIKLDALGSNAFPLSNLVRDGDKLHFELALDQQTLVFDATIDEQIRGTMTTQGESTTFALKRLPELPAPKDKAEAWQQDIDAVLTRFLRYDLSFPTDKREEARQRLVALRARVAAMPDAKIMVELSRIVALSGNTHTRLYLIRNRTEVRRLPIRIWDFAGEYRVVRATAEQKALLGCRLTRIGKTDVREAARRVRGIKAGNDQWQRYMSSYLLTSPETLFGSDVIADMESVPMTFECGDKRTTAALRPLPLVKKTSATESWWDLPPERRDADVEWLPALSAERAPLYLRHPELNYWFEYLPAEKILYLNYNRSQSMSSEPLKDFGERMAKEFEHEVRALVVDLRFNTGGDLTQATPLMKMLHEKTRDKPVFVIMGRTTFSAGITHAAQWKTWGATIVGEPMGDGLDAWSEGGNVILPNSKLAAHYANALHSYSTKPHPGVVAVEEMEIESLEPQMPVEATWKDYIEGRDPAMEAVRIKTIADEFTCRPPAWVGPLPWEHFNVCNGLGNVSN